VFVRYDVWMRVVDGLVSYVNEIDNSGKRRLSENDDVWKILFDERTLSVLRDIDNHIDGIVEKIRDNKYRDSARKVLLYIAENIDKSLRFLDNPPEWFKRWSFDEMLSEFADNWRLVMFNPSSVELMELIKHVPMPVEAVIRNKSHYGVLLYPSDRELSRIEISRMETYKLMHDFVIPRYVMITPDGSASIYGYEIYLPRYGLFKLLSRSMGVDDAFEVVYRDIVDRLREYGKVVVFKSYSIGDVEVDIDLDNSVVGTASKYNVKAYVEFVDLKNYEGVISFTARYGDRVIKFSNQFVYKYKCIVEGCSVPLDDNVLKFTSVDELFRKLSDGIRIVSESLDFIERIDSKFSSLAEKYGMDYNREFDDETISFKAELNNEKSPAIVIVELGKDYSVAGYGIEFHVSPLSISESLRLVEDIRKLLKGSEEIEYRHVENIILVGYKGKVNGRIDVEEFFRRLFELLDGVKSLYDVYVEKSEEQSKSEEEVKVYLSREFHVASYILRETLGHRALHLYEAMNHSIPKLESRIKRTLNLLAKKYNISYDDSNSVFSYNFYCTLISRLIENGYIKITPDLKLYINGKRFSEIVAKYIEDISEEDERNMAVSVLIDYIYYLRHLSKESREPDIVSKLVEMNLVTPETISLLVNLDPSTFNVRDLAKEVNGKRLWDYLSDEAKNRYFYSLSTYALRAIYLDKDLRTVFSDSIEYIERLIFTYDNSSSKTRAVVEYHRDLVGLPDNVEIINDEKNGFYGVSIGNRIVQIHMLGKYRTDGKDDNIFIIYDKDSKIGIMIEAKTVNEALEKYETKHLRVTRILNTLLDMKDRLYRKYNIAVTSAEYGDYKYYYVVNYNDDKNRHIIIDEYVVDKIKKIIREIEQKKNQEENLVSA